MDLFEELKEAAGAADLDLFRSDLIDAVKIRATDVTDPDELDFAFVCEVGSRLLEAEEFQDFIPCHFTGAGYRNRKLRVDGYEFDEADDSMRLLVADFRGGEETETLTKTRAKAAFDHLMAFVDESASGRIWGSAEDDAAQNRELSGLIEQKHSLRTHGNRAISRYRLYLITDSVLSDRVKDLPSEEFDGIPVEFHIWDASRLMAVSSSMLGTEELEIDFTEFVEGGLPCLPASRTEDYESFLCVIPGNALADLYDRYGSRLLEGNVRSFLSSAGKINRGIQGTVRSEPGRFFIYNNGISATATSAEVVMTEYGAKIVKARYLQIVNGGQTTASLHVAKRKDRVDLEGIHVQMKLSVVRAKNNEMLDGMIQSIARYSNSQNKVSDADFFSNHPFHRAIERRSRAIKAPAAEGAQFNTFWFYERARGQYLNEQSKMTLAQKRAFQRENPRSQLITKTDLAKYENSWRMLPHIVSRGAQKNFVNFAEYVGKEYGALGQKFDNDTYYRAAVSRAILFKFIERMVSQAKATWYGGDYRAQIVTYTLARLAHLIATGESGYALNFKVIWAKQGVPLPLANQLEIIAKSVAATITSPPVAQMNVGEWCKKEECWQQVVGLSVPLLPEMDSVLATEEEAASDNAEARAQGQQDAAIDSVLEVVRLSQTGCWARLTEWSKRFSPIYGVEADLVRNAASRRGWVPSDRQAAKLIKLLRRMELEGFQSN